MAKVRVPSEVLEFALDFPEGVSISGVQFVENTVEFSIEGSFDTREGVTVQLAEHEKVAMGWEVAEGVVRLLGVGVVAD